MSLNNLKPPKGATKSRKRKGRGQGSTLGKTSGKGQKGQKSRSGGKIKPGFEGGQMPLQRRVPKIGFTNSNTKNIGVVNVAKLNEFFNDGDTVNKETLVEKRLVRKNIDGVKVLGQGELSKKLNVQVYKASESAQTKITGAGGTIEVLGG